MFEAQLLTFSGQLEATLIRPDGTHRYLGVVAGGSKHVQPVGFWRALWRQLRRESMIPLGMSFLAFLAWMLHRELGTPSLLMMALVTDGGIDLMTQDFANQGVGFDIANFNFHGTGTSNTAEAVTQTDLIAPVSLARVAGVQTHPAAKKFNSTATITYGSTLTIAEWALFNAAGSGLPPSGGTLWDRRVVSPTQGVNSGDGVSWNYSCLAASGGT